MWTVSKLASRAGLSRTALLYYESIGLMRAPARSQGNYRFYDSGISSVCSRSAPIAMRASSSMTFAPSSIGRPAKPRAFLDAG